jgi:hypothetical protein
LNERIAMPRTLKPEARDPQPIEMSAQQKDPYTARPEDFPIRSYFDPIKEVFHGQAANSPEAKERSREKFNQGSVRAEGNTNHAGRPHSA